MTESHIRIGTLPIFFCILTKSDKSIINGIDTKKPAILIRTIITMFIIFPIVYIVFLFSFDFVSSKIKITIKPTRDTQIKMNLDFKLICEGIPEEFTTYLKMIRKLEFEEEPEYSKYINLFDDLFNRKVF